MVVINVSVTVRLGYCNKHKLLFTYVKMWSCPYTFDNSINTLMIILFKPRMLRGKLSCACVSSELAVNSRSHFSITIGAAIRLGVYLLIVKIHFVHDMLEWLLFVDNADYHYSVCRLDIRQDIELATRYGHPKTAFKQDRISISETLFSTFRRFKPWENAEHRTTLQ